ncbi:monofunctional biosynthetic peptidoglycan transglycosylase [Rhodomicrobium lacus]|uniref:monofunctional biosynthetic peptidoglycan transglycosylase n=1 Tax=Rhodomicrobium lacus TaxID=2498452 RepID=UPI000F8D10B9|nr:monofunctional biosynthetic peptidoglycan transglycosylase [Rhodomicrobium lacus]
MTDLAPKTFERLVEATRPHDDNGRHHRWRDRALRIVLIALALFLLAPYVLTLVFTVVNPPLSALMARQALLGRPVIHEWRDLDEISPNLIAQVIVSEDGRFCQHHGVDWQALDKAVDAVKAGKPKGGGSTITMQTAKNMFLWSDPAWLRKPFEIPLAAFMDAVLGKRRVMEIYLNIVEWAPGIYGAQAAARHHFKTSADDLSMQQAAQLAAALPNPKRRNAGKPGPRVAALANRLRARAVRESDGSFCVLEEEASAEEEAGRE